MSLVTCEDCGHQVSDKAAACPQCGRPMAPVVQPPPPEPHETTREIVVEPSPGVAAVLSFLLPGLGQMYRGNVGAGLLWLLLVVVGYMALVIPGVVLHLLVHFRCGRPFKASPHSNSFSAVHAHYMADKRFSDTLRPRFVARDTWAESQAFTSNCRS